MKNAGIRGVRALAMLAIAIGSSAGNAAAGPAEPSSAFGAVSCGIGESPRASLAMPRNASESLRTSRTAQPAVLKAAQVTRNERADVTFEIRPAAGSAIEVSGRSGDLQVKKTVQNTGEFLLELSVAGDRVVVTVTGQGTTVTRGDTTRELRRNATTGEQANAVRRLLADSAAVLRFRAVNAALIEADDRSAASLAFISSDAIVGMLTGDVGAPRRIAQFMARTGLSKVRRAGMAIDCFTVMETRMMDAWVDYESCVASVLGWTYWQDLCAYRWVLQVESYWFSFIACSGFNF